MVERRSRRKHLATPGVGSTGFLKKKIVVSELNEYPGRHSISCALFGIATQANPVILPKVMPSLLRFRMCSIVVSKKRNQALKPWQGLSNTLVSHMNVVIKQMHV